MYLFSELSAQDNNNGITLVTTLSYEIFEMFFRSFPMITY